MSRRQPRVNRPPYTQLLSALRKTDLVGLCREFRLSTEGSVVGLRNRLKDYLNLHRDRLYRNPRYNALFPKHRRLPVVKKPSSPTTSAPSTPTLSYRSLSFDSWHGIDDPPQDHPPLAQQPLAPVPAHPPPLDNPNGPDQPPLSPTASLTESDADSFPPAIHLPVERKSLLPTPLSCAISYRI